MNLRTEHLARCWQTLEKSLDNRNSTAHDYGQGFAEETLSLMPAFLKDARCLETTLRERFGHAET
jgi:hypothetical protein